MNNYNYNPFDYNNQNGTMYQSAKEPAFTNPLSQNKINELRKNHDAFSLMVSQEELDKAICTHRDPVQKRFTIVPEGDHFRCTICGAVIKIEEMTPEEVKDIVDKFFNLLQVSKMFYVDIPENVAKQYYSMLPFVEKAAKMYSISLENYKQYMGRNQVSNAYDQYNPVQSFTNVIGGVGFGGQPMGNPYPYGQTNGFTGQPPVQPNYGVPAFGGNPFIQNGGYNNSMMNNMNQPDPNQNNMAQQVANPAFQNNNNPNPAIVNGNSQGQTPPPQGDVTITKKFSV